MSYSRPSGPADGTNITQDIAINATDATSMKAIRRQIQRDIANAVQAAVNRSR